MKSIRISMCSAVGALSMKTAIRWRMILLCSMIRVKPLWSEATLHAETLSTWRRITRELSPDVNYPIQIKVGALQAAPGAYDATFYNGQAVVGTKNTTTNYYEYTYDLDMKELLTASESVKGLMKLNDVTFSSAFSLGYVITYRYTARDGRKHDYPRKISQL